MKSCNLYYDYPNYVMFFEIYIRSIWATDLHKVVNTGLQLVAQEVENDLTPCGIFCPSVHTIVELNAL